MTLRSWRFAAVVALPLVALGILAAQQTLTQRFPQLENDNVKVWKSVIAPNAPLAPHRHEHGRVLIALKGGSVDIVQQNGPTEHLVWETGKAYWLPPSPPNTMHSDINKGTSVIEVMVVELKNDK
jgi:quercetin dioxygenase-like cupin family protein